MNKILILLLLLAAGCATKKTTSHTFKQVEFDSITYNKTQKIYPSIHDTLYVDRPCDSLGNLKPFNHSYHTAQGKITVSNNKGSIMATIALDSVSQTKVESSNTKKKDTVTTDKEVVKLKTNWNLWIYLIISIILNVILIYAYIKK